MTADKSAHLQIDESTLTVPSTWDLVLSQITVYCLISQESSTFRPNVKTVTEKSSFVGRMCIHTYVFNINRIFYLQKRVVRAIVNSDYRAHSAFLFAKLYILDIFQVNSFQIAKFMFCHPNQLLPPMLLNSFLTSSEVHNYGTRAANHYRSNSFRTNLKQFTILYQGPKIWNSLPISITSSSSLFFTFKKKCVSFYL